MPTPIPPPRPVGGKRAGEGYAKYLMASTVLIHPTNFCPHFWHNISYASPLYLLAHRTHVRFARKFVKLTTEYVIRYIFPSYPLPSCQKSSSHTCETP